MAETQAEIEKWALHFIECDCEKCTAQRELEKIRREAKQ
jgi:hypothetical protein